MLEKQARKILASLEAKPSLLYEILRIANDEGFTMILSPWLTLENPKIPGDIYYERRDIEGNPVGQIARNPNNHAEWMWQIKGGSSSEANTTNAELTHLVDAELTNLGWILT